MASESERRPILPGSARSRSSTAGAAAAPGSVTSPTSSLVVGNRVGSFARTYETERGRAVRLPIGYGSVNSPIAGYVDVSDSHSGRTRSGSHATPTTRDEAEYVGEDSITAAGPAAAASQASAMISRYKYYSRIAPGTDSQLLMPAHVVPPMFLIILPFQRVTKQSSLITIFSVWNTMMGTSLLSMPWAVKEAGFATSLGVLLFMTAVTFYTAYLVLRSYTNLGRSGVLVSEFSDVCRHYLGKWGELVAVLFSAAALLGGIIVYWVLLSNFLYHSGCFVHSQIYHEVESDSSPNTFTIDNRTYHVLCPDGYPSEPVSPTGVPNVTASPQPVTAHTADYGNATQPLFQTLWSQTHTVPLYLIALLFPLVCIKSPGFFSKFNALGTISVFYVLAFVAVKAYQWGLHLDFSSVAPMSVIHQFSPTFVSMAGILSLALFSHCFIVSLMREQRHPQNNTRDLLIAYICVSATYIIVGLTFYAVYPLAKDCITQNLLDNIPSADVLAFTARIFLFVQMITVFPLLMYILRAQLMHYMFHSVYPSWVHVSLLHLVVIGMAVAVAVFYPNIGNILRFSGALCGLAYIFTLPPLIAVLEARVAGRLSVGSLIVHGSIMLIGVANFVAQFLFINK